jgi:hypothetical protein
VLALASHKAMVLRQKVWDHNKWIARRSAELQAVTLVRASLGLTLDAPIGSDRLPQVTPRAYFAAVDRLGSSQVSVWSCTPMRRPRRGSTCGS